MTEHDVTQDTIGLGEPGVPPNLYNALLKENEALELGLLGLTRILAQVGFIIATKEIKDEDDEAILKLINEGGKEVKEQLISFQAECDKLRGKTE
jgi:hypothetical protein